MAERPVALWLLTSVGDSALALDARAPQRVVEVADPQRPERELAGGVVVGEWPDETAVRRLPDGTVALGRTVLWSLLDPLKPWPQTDLLTAGSDPVAAERALRHEAERVWDRLRWWAELQPTLRQQCLALLDRHGEGPGRAIAVLEAMAASVASSPFADWTAPSSSGIAPDVAAADGTDLVLDSTASAPGTAASRKPIPVDADALRRWMLAADGLGAAYGGDFTPRAEQADMAAAVARSCAGRSGLLVEAGTGIGKTLAYLAPLLARLSEGGRRAVVATHTRALQIQILAHDLPLLQPELSGVRARLLMGRNNYLCRRQRSTFSAREVAGPEDALVQACWLIWLEATSGGLREEIAAHPILAPYTRELFDGVLPCQPRLCYDDGGCFVQRARRRARQADLLVVNHSLLMHDRLAGGSLIGPYDWLVVDEAHRLPSVVVDTHAIGIDRGRLTDLTELVGKSQRAGPLPERFAMLRQRLEGLGDSGSTAATAAADCGRAVGSALQAYGRWWREMGEQFDAVLTNQPRPTGRVRIRDKDVAFAVLRESTAHVLTACAAASTALAALDRRLEALPDPPSDLDDDLAVLGQLAPALESLQHDIRFVTIDPDEDWVTWFDPAPRGGPRAAGATPLAAGPLLSEYWHAAELQPVMTSATLAIGEDFSHMIGELGMYGRRPPTTTLAVTSPFDYAEQMLLLAPRNLPPPECAEHADAIVAVVAALTQTLRRKTMVLFTSYRLLGQVATGLSAAGVGTADPARFAEAKDGSAELLLQTPHGGTAGLADRFRSLPQALLLATTTFWEGVDFPGSDLEVLVVTKLPFLVPTDPWVEARCERIQARGEDPFTTFVLRDAVLRLRQGIGRLIRRSGDRGVVVLLDARLHARGYGITFLGALPVQPRLCRDARDLTAQAADFFAEAAGSTTTGRRS